MKLKIYDRRNCFRVNYSLENFDRFLGQKCRSLLESTRIVNVWLKKSICRHIQPHCHQFRMNVASLFFMLFIQWSKFSMFVFFFSVHECLCIQEGGENKLEEEELFFQLSIKNIKLIFLQATKRSEDVFTLNWNSLIFIFPERSNDVETS